VGCTVSYRSFAKDVHTNYSTFSFHVLFYSCKLFRPHWKTCAAVWPAGFVVLKSPGAPLIIPAVSFIHLSSVSIFTEEIQTWREEEKFRYYTKTLITNKCTKRVLSSIVTHSYMFRPCWVIFREKFFVTVSLRLHFYSWVRMCCWLCTALFLEAWTVCGPGLQAGTAESSRLQYAVSSTFSLNCKVQP
jgi:hypothetical protein